MTEFIDGINYAKEMDSKDPLADYRKQFHIPKDKDGKEIIYLCGNSLGLQPKITEKYILQELEDWKNLGVEGHFHAKNAWMPYHEFLTDNMARLVGAEPIEVVVMNSLTVNLHLMLASFYRPTTRKRKIVIEYSPFPSDIYAVKSQIAYHGFDPDKDLIQLMPKQGTDIVSLTAYKNIIQEHKDEIALILIAGVNYYTGQLYPMEEMTKIAHESDIIIGFDLAHAVGNVELNLHEMGCDFAVWCSYKYLNSGPGSLGGCFVHERHAYHFDLPRFAGWWGHDKITRFKMGPDFQPIPGAEGWQLSNPPILSMAAIRASLEIFNQAGIKALTRKSSILTSYLEFLIKAIPNENIQIITPEDPKKRGCQLSIRVNNANRALFDTLTEKGVISDWREPDVIRVAPVPLYNSFVDVYEFVRILKECLN